MKIISKQDESINKLEKMGFRIDGSFFSYEEKIITMRRDPSTYQSQLIQVEEDGSVCGESLQEFINKI